MTVPSLTARGYMRWPLRAWVESLCTPLPDGSWLVQAPITGNQEPRLYLLPDAEIKNRYLRWATVKGWIWVLVRSLAPLYSVLLVAANSFPLIGQPGGVTARAAPSIVFVPFLLWFLAYVVVADRLLGLLPDARRQSADNWLRSGVIVRSGVEWDAIYLSQGLALAFIASWLTTGLFGAFGVLYVVTTIDACGSADILSGTPLEARRYDSPEASIICRNLYLWLGGVVLAVVFSCWTLIRQQKTWKAGRAKRLPNPV